MTVKIKNTIHTEHGIVIPTDTNYQAVKVDGNRVRIKVDTGIRVTVPVEMVEIL